MKKNALIKPVGAVPLGDKIFVRRLKEREKTAGGLYVAEVAKEKPQFGIVVAAGEDVKNPYLARGFVIITFGKYAGTEIAIDGEPLLSMREEEVVALIADKTLIESLETEGA